MSEETEYAVADDGHVGRLVGVWNPEKLFYVNRYMDIFCTGMYRSWPNLAYADLFAGPGLCVDRDTKTESPGSPLLALQHSRFKRLFLNDSDPRATAALAARIPASGTLAHVRLSTRDRNVAVDEAREFLFPAGIRKHTLGLAVIDPTGFQMRFDSIARLASGIRLDLLIIFMTGYVRRFIRTDEYAAALDGFYGSTLWRRILEQHDEGDRLTFRKLLDLYEAQLVTLGYVHVDDDARILNRQQATIYHIVFASKHPRGAEFFQKIRQRTYNGQQHFPGPSEP